MLGASPPAAGWLAETKAGNGYLHRNLDTTWTIYITVGNASPDEDGTARAGDNLFTVSIVALDLKTGAYKWHFQEIHHDLWDYDNAVSPILADIPYHGRTRKVLLHAGKNGMVYIFDCIPASP